MGEKNQLKEQELSDKAAQLEKLVDSKDEQMKELKSSLDSQIKDLKSELDQSKQTIKDLHLEISSLKQGDALKQTESESTLN